MKKLILSMFLLLVFYFVSGQNTFTLLISDSINEFPGDIVELSDHSFVLSSEYDHSSINKALQRFFKINSEGKITHDSIFSNPNGSCNLLKLVFINDTNIFCIGDWENLNYKDQRWVTSIDSGLNFSWDKKYQLNYNYAKTAATFLNSQGRIISVATATNDIVHTYLYFQEYSLKGDTIKSSIDSSASGAIIFAMIEFPDSGKYRAAVISYNQNSPGQLLIIDSSLKVGKVDPIPNSISMYNAVKKINDSGFYLSGNIYPDKSYDYAIMSLNKNDNCKKISIIGQQDTIDYAGIDQSMDFMDPNKVFVGGTSNIALYFGHYGQQNSWYVLSNFDSVLNKRWTKYYGGDAYYLLQSVVATKDGGVLLVGTRYDYPTQSNKCDIYLIKVDENGILSTSDHMESSQTHNAIVYPNPGSDYLIIESGPQISGAQFLMTTIDGKQGVAKTLTERKTTLVTQSLPSGTYIWKIVFKDKIIETGKWVKE